MSTSHWQIKKLRNRGVKKRAQGPTASKCGPGLHTQALTAEPGAQSLCFFFMSTTRLSYIHPERPTSSFSVWALCISLRPVTSVLLFCGGVKGGSPSASLFISLSVGFLKAPGADTSHPPSVALHQWGKHPNSLTPGWITLRYVFYLDTQSFCSGLSSSNPRW